MKLHAGRQGYYTLLLTAVASASLLAFLVRKSRSREEENERHSLGDDSYSTITKSDHKSLSSSSASANISVEDQPKTQESAVAVTILHQMFAKAAAQVSELKHLSNGDKLLFYGLYKQATLGDRSDGQKPSKWNVVATAKYEAWGKFAGMPKETAMIKYVDIAQQFMAEETKNGSVAHENDDIIYSDEDDEIDETSSGEEEEHTRNGRRLASAPSEKTENSSMKESSSLGMGMRPSTLNYSSVTSTMDLKHGNGSFPCIAGDSTGAEQEQATCSSESVFDATNRNDAVALKSLLERPDINADQVDDSGQSALHIAADRGYTDCVQILLSSGASPNACDKEGISVLQAAVIGGNSLAVVRILLEAGADPDHEDIDGDSPRSCAMDDGSEQLMSLFK